MISAIGDTRREKHRRKTTVKIYTLLAVSLSVQFHRRFSTLRWGKMENAMAAAERASERILALQHPAAHIITRHGERARDGRLDARTRHPLYGQHPLSISPNAETAGSKFENLQRVRTQMLHVQRFTSNTYIQI